MPRLAISCRRSNLLPEKLDSITRNSTAARLVAPEDSRVRSDKHMRWNGIVRVDDDRRNAVLRQIGGLKGPRARRQMTDAYAKVCVVGRIELSGTDEHFIAAHEQGSLITPEQSARSLLAHLAGRSTGGIWTVNEE